MNHDVFISYSTKDKISADAVCAGLEASGVRCWIAPRDIRPGKDWGEAIIDAIAESRVMVLVFSVSANESPQVKREVQRAFEKGVSVVPLRIDAVEPAKSLAYYLSAVQWLDATPPVQGQVQKLVDVVLELLPAKPATEARPALLPVAPFAAPAPLAYAIPQRPPGAGARIAIAAVVVALLLLVGVVAMLYTVHGPSGGRPVAIAPLAPTTAPLVIPTAPATSPTPDDSMQAQSEQAIREILQDLRSMDAQLGLVNRTFSLSMSESTAAEIVSLRDEDPSRGGFVSYTNVPAAADGGFNWPEGVVKDRPTALGALGASADDVVAFANELFAIKQFEGILPDRYNDSMRRIALADEALKLGYGNAEQLEHERQLMERRLAMAREGLQATFGGAHLSGLKLLDEVRSHLPADVDAQLGSLKNLQPAQLVDRGQQQALNDQLEADFKKLEQRNDALKAEMKQLRDHEVAEWCAALRPPFQPGDRPLEQITPLYGVYEIDPEKSAHAAIIKSIDAAGSGSMKERIACLFAYAAIFSKIDPAANDYARAAVAYSLQMDNPNGRALYLSKLLEGPAKAGGMREGDLLVDYGGTAIEDAEQLGSALKVMPAGEPVRVEFFRRNDQGRFERQTATLPHGGSLGATFLPV